VIPNPKVIKQKKHLFILTVIIAIAFIVVGLTVNSNNPHTTSIANIQVDGAIVVPNNPLKDTDKALDKVEDKALDKVKDKTTDYVEIRAYRPDLTIKLTWDVANKRNRSKLILNNVLADHIQVDILASERTNIMQADAIVDEQSNNASVDTRKITNTAVELVVEAEINEIELAITTKPSKDNYQFALIGDSQGRNEILERIIEEVNTKEIDFLIHLGDMVPSGHEQEYQDFFAVMQELQVPYYTVPGNHDTRLNGRDIYQNTLAPFYYSFEFGNYRYVFMDTAELTVDQQQFSWLQAQLKNDIDTYVFMHAPIYDPRGLDHSFRDLEAAQQVFDVVTADAKPIRAVFSGHVHMFHQQQIADTLFVTSGGAGASFYATPEEGGFYHYVIASLQKQSIDIQEYPVEITENNNELVLLKGEQGVILTIEELQKMEQATGYSSFENQFGNINGKGTYSGILVEDLLELIGGMTKDETLNVYSTDGYKQEFSYENIYAKESGILNIQGLMVLAISINGDYPPEWQEGYRLIFMPEDGVYSNDDCANTSFGEQGFNTYPSAGARWVRDIARLEVR